MKSLNVIFQDFTQQIAELEMRKNEMFMMLLKEG